MSGKSTLTESQRFSQGVLEQLREIFVGEEVFVGGSVSRREALPMSDVDVVYFGEEPLTPRSSVAGVDRVDCVHMSCDVAERLIKSMSPESGFLDSIPLVAASNHPYYSWYNEPVQLLNRFIWLYVTRNLDDRSDESRGYNLKYSPGASRDILLIDLYGRFVRFDELDSQPEIESAIGKLREVVKDFDYATLNRSIEFVMFTKSRVLSAHQDSPDRGRTYLSEKTLEWTMAKDEEFAERIRRNMTVFWRTYAESKTTICTFLDILLDLAMTNHGALIYYFIKKALAILHGEGFTDVKKVLRSTDGEKFPVLAALILGRKLDEQELFGVAQRFAGDPAHYYTNRLIAKSREAGPDVLEFLLTNSRFALDGWTNDRYVRMVEERLSRR